MNDIKEIKNILNKIRATQGAIFNRAELHAEAENKYLSLIKWAVEWVATLKDIKDQNRILYYIVWLFRFPIIILAAIWLTSFLFDMSSNHLRSGLCQWGWIHHCEPIDPSSQNPDFESGL